MAVCGRCCCRNRLCNVNSQFPATKWFRRQPDVLFEQVFYPHNKTKHTKNPLKMHKIPVNQSRFTERQKQQIWKYTKKMDVEAQSMKSNSAIFKVASYAINSVICTLMKNAAFLHRK